MIRKRYCPLGHDKLAPHGLYVWAKKDRTEYKCAICYRMYRNKRWKLKKC